MYTERHREREREREVLEALTRPLDAFAHARGALASENAPTQLLSSQVRSLFALQVQNYKH